MNHILNRNTLKAGITSALLMLPLASPVFADAGTNEAFEQLDRSSPAELLARLGEFIAARDIEGVMSIKDEGAAIVEWGGGLATTKEDVRRVYEDFFETNPDLKVNALQIVEADGLAIILGDYTLDYTNSNGAIVSVEGRFGDIVRQQPDGSWLYLLDNPYAP